MIPVALLTEAIPALMGLVKIIRGLMPDEEQEALKAWASLLKTMPARDAVDEGWQREVNQFLVTLTLRRGYSPAYTWESYIAVPVDMLTDLIDLLVGGWSSGGKWNLKTLLRDPVKDRLAWRVTIKGGNDHVILDEADEWLARRGRSRDYSPVPAIRVDRDWLADAISTLVG